MRSEEEQMENMETLRRNAQKQINPVSRQKISGMSTDDIAKLLQELETHQIELEMQNDELQKTQSILLDMRDKYSDLYDFAPVGYVTMNVKGIIIQSNLTFSDMLGVPRSSLIKNRLSQYIFKQDQKNYYRHLNNITDTQGLHSSELRVVTASGKIFWVRIDSLCAEYSADKCLQIRSILTIITQQKHNEERIRTLSQVVEQSPVSVIVTDTEGSIEYTNKTFSRVSGYTQDEIKGQTPRFLKSGNTPDAYYHDLWQTIIKGHSWKGELQNRRKNGELFWEQAHVSSVLDDAGNISHYFAVKEDITQRKLQDEKLLHLAHFDTLTDLPNRFLALDRLSQLIIETNRKQECLAVLFLDLDDFKKINDTMGHESGDKLLVETASRLRDEVREGDTVGRLGGDEFIILLSGLKKDADVIPIAENLMTRFREPFKIDGKSLRLTSSIGIATYPADGNSASELLRYADSAMYHSKKQGRNTYSFFTEAMNKEVSRRLLLEDQLDGALERNEFQVYYQPQVDINTRRIIGFEALLRWFNPALGEVTSTEFIPVAEQTGHIILIGQYVLSQSLNQLARWQKTFQQAFTMSVNLSPPQFRDPNLTNYIEQLLNQTGITGALLQLEITEGVLLSGHTYVNDMLSVLHDMGVEISMDDFGTGYSSLNYLRLYPFDSLKIDRSFINEMTDNLADQKLVNATISMAHSLGLKVIAEGVETEAQLALLSSQHCDIAQGYLFSKAKPAEEIVNLLNTQSSQ